MTDNQPPPDELTALTIDSIVAVPAPAATAEGAALFLIETQRLQLEKQKIANQAFTLDHCCPANALGEAGK